MAVILKFATSAPIGRTPSTERGKTTASAGASASPTAGGAEIVIFPGVRIERYEDTCPYEKVADATAK